MDGDRQSLRSHLLYNYQDIVKVKWTSYSYILCNISVPQRGQLQVHRKQSHYA